MQRPIPFFDAKATRDALDPGRLIDALRHRFMAGCVAPPRHVHTIESPGDGSRLTSLIMPAWVPGEHYGVKVVNVAPANAARGLPGLFASYTLYDAVTGQPVAIMDGGVITAHRTAAASALAASYLARKDANHLLVVGAGRVASLLPRHMAAVRGVSRVSVWARQADAAERLCAMLRTEGFDAHTVKSLHETASLADIISCATMATEPLIQGAWLRPGTHLDLIGGFTPAMRETDDACFANRAGVWVDTDEALAKSGDLLGPIERGVLDPSQVRGTLAALCQGQAAGRTDDQERTVFKSVGHALEDLAAALLVHAHA